MIGTDPGALVEHDDGTRELADVTLWKRDDGSWRISIEHDDERVDEITLRPDFLDEVIAQARAREAAA